ncbi:hypothetical protein JCM3770_004281 [Rhodotorula araucariae]
MPTALLLVDIQHDFLPPSGALAVQGGDTILAGVYLLLGGHWDLVVASQDYHPPGHISFCTTHARPPFTTATVTDPRTGATKEQELWPEHCVQGTLGCELDEGVARRLDERRAAGHRVEVVRKGADQALDAYSAFDAPLAHAPSSPSPLTQLLLDAKITTLVVVGLATDYCVRQSALAALRGGGGGGADVPAPWQPAAGGEVLVVRECVRGVVPAREAAVLDELAAAGARVVSAEGDEVRRLLR